MAKKKSEPAEPKHMGRPPIPGGAKVETFTFRTRPEWKDWLSRFALQCRRDKADVIDDALEAYAQSQRIRGPPETLRVPPMSAGASGSAHSIGARLGAGRGGPDAGRRGWTISGPAAGRASLASEQAEDHPRNRSPDPRSPAGRSTLPATLNTLNPPWVIQSVTAEGLISRPPLNTTYNPVPDRRGTHAGSTDDDHPQSN